MFGLFFLPVPIPTPPPSFQVIKTKNKNEPPFTPFRFPSPPLSQYDECPNIAGTTRSKTDPACPQGTYIPEGKTLTKLITDYSCDKLSSVMHFCSFYGGDGGPGWGRFLGGGRGRRLLQRQVLLVPPMWIYASCTQRLLPGQCVGASSILRMADLCPCPREVTGLLTPPPHCAWELKAPVPPTPVPVDLLLWAGPVLRLREKEVGMRET